MATAPRGSHHHPTNGASEPRGRGGSFNSGGVGAGQSPYGDRYVDLQSDEGKDLGGGLMGGRGLAGGDRGAEGGDESEDDFLL